MASFEAAVGLAGQQLLAVTERGLGSVFEIGGTGDSKVGVGARIFAYHDDGKE